MNGKLAVHRLQKDEIEFPGPDKFGQIDQVGIEESLKDLADDLMRSNEQYHLPFRPVADLVYLTENHFDKDELAHKPKRLHDHPEKKIQLEIHLPNKGVTQHHQINGPVF